MQPAPALKRFSVKAQALCPQYAGMISYSLDVTTRAMAQATGLSRRFEGCSLHAYADPASGGAPWTIGWGSTRIFGRPVHPDDVIAKDVADNMMRADLLGAMNAVMAAVSVPMNGDELGALTSFMNNVGPGETGVKDGFVRLKNGAPSSMLRFLNAGDFDLAAGQFELWVNGAGHRMLGLVRRRFAEEQVFLGALNMTIGLPATDGDV